MYVLYRQSTAVLYTQNRENTVYTYEGTNQRERQGPVRSGTDYLQYPQDEVEVEDLVAHMYPPETDPRAPRGWSEASPAARRSDVHLLLLLCARGHRTLP